MTRHSYRVTRHDDTTAPILRVDDDPGGAALRDRSLPISRRDGRCRRSSPARLHYLRNRVHDCRLLREMDVVVRAWHWGVTFATAKKLPSLAAGTAAILLRRIAE